MRLMMVFSFMLAIVAFAESSLPIQEDAGAFAREHYTSDLRDVCPNPLIIQKDWLMQPEHAAVMQLIGGIGEGAGVAAQGRYSGPLGSTGIELVLLEGGAGIGMGDGETAYFTLYAGNSKARLKPHLAFVSSATAMIFSERFPTTAVVAPLDVNPQVLLYDPATYPEGFADLEALIALADKADAKIYVTSTAFGYAKFLVDAGVPEDLFVEGYRGDLENFVSHGGTWLNQGLATSEAWNLENGRGWQKPIAYSLLNNFGYDPYPSALAVASDKLEQLTPCLEHFVPLVQQAQVDYISNPVEINEAIIAFNEAGLAASFWHTPRGMVESMLHVAIREGVVGNGHNDTLGDFDIERMERLLEAMRPNFDNRAKHNLQVSDILSNQFIDPTIGLRIEEEQ